ncbi:MAG: class I SAM-dependent methyltransferase [Chitinophagaceae bacterium]
MINVSIAKFIMKRFQRFPSKSDAKAGLLQEIFNHKTFLSGTDAEKKQIMLNASNSKFEDELGFPVDKYFGFSLRPYLEGKTVLDLGCLTGGRSAVWIERYGIKHLTGIDVDPVYIDAATQFAASKNIENATFKTAFGESLPFADGSFDSIVTFDVFEHVQELEKVLAECYRVLKPGGQLVSIFPSYYQPIEHHLSLVTRFPGLQYLFSGKTLVRAYYEILDERGEDAYWYKRSIPELKDYEKGNTINGTTISLFRKLLRKKPWKKIFQSHLPIGSVGRSIERRPWLKPISILMKPLTYLPGLEEVFQQRVSFIMEKA